MNNKTKNQMNKLQSLIALRIDGLELGNFHYQDDEMAEVACAQNGLALQYVWNKTYNICLIAVKQNGLALRYIGNKIPALCEAAVKQNPLAGKYIYTQSKL